MTESKASRVRRVEDRGDKYIIKGKRLIGAGNSPAVFRAPVISSHFLETAIDATNAPWILHETHTTTASTFAIVAAALAGEAKASTDTVAVAADAFTVAFGNLQFEPDTNAVGGNMFLEARVKFGGTAQSEFFFGFADATNETNDISYAITVTDSTIATSGPDDAFGFLISGTATGGDFDSSSSTVVLGGISSIGTTDTAFVPGVTTAFKSTARGTGGSGGSTYPSSAVVVTDATYYTLRVELDVNGNGLLFKDGKFFASFPAAITKTAPLCGMVNGIARGTATTYATFDYVAVGGTIALQGS